MSMRARLARLEATTRDYRPLREWTDAELEAYLRRTGGIADGVHITDVMLAQISAQGLGLLNEARHYLGGD